MAYSRLEKIGNIHTRITGLIRSGAMKWEDRPLFYDIYSAFKPLKENKYMDDDVDASVPVRKIFYEEDKERATKDLSNMLAFDMNEKKTSKPEWTFRQQTIQKPPEESKEKIFNLNNLDLQKD